jgi:hypothetical protein
MTLYCQKEDSVDKTHDLVLGVLGSQWERSRPGGVESYLESIKRAGFTGRKVMLVWGIHPTTRSALLLHGFELIDLPTPKEPFFHARMRVCWEYLRDHYKEFRYIFWLDVKDLILQSNPSDWMENSIGNAKLIGSTECVTIEQEETNQLWAISILGAKKYQEIKDCEVINGGTWAGEAESMTEVFHQVHLGCKTYTGGHPPCQIWINYVMHSMLKDVLRIPRWSEGFAACLHPCWSPWRVPCWPYMRDTHPVLDINTCTLHAGTVPEITNSMIVFNPIWGKNRRLRIESLSHPLQGIECVDKPKGKVFSIVHGYDRDWDIKSLFEFKYRTILKEDANLLEEYKKYNEEMAKNLPVERRALRRPGRESAISSYQLPQPGRVFRRHT